jgi:hypothetical protein
MNKNATYRAAKTRKIMKLKPLLLAALSMAACSTFAQAQEITISNGGGAWTLDGFTLNSNTDVATLNSGSPDQSSNYVSDLTPYLPAGASNIDAAAGGWVFSNDAGTVVVAQDDSTPAGIQLATAVGDPFVSYSYFFTNTSGSDGTFSVSFSTSSNTPGSSVSPFPSTTYAPSYIRASLGVVLTDGAQENSDGTTPSVTATATQTATASYTAGGTVPLNSIALTVGPLTASEPNTPTVVGSMQSPNYATYVTGPSGTFDALNVLLSGSYSNGADVAVSGRVELVPEPSPVLLLGVGGLALALVAGIRRKLIA